MARVAALLARSRARSVAPRWLATAHSHPRPVVARNPPTGPFYVEGALPGDTLVVRLNKVRANKKTARQGGRISSRLR